MSPATKTSQPPKYMELASDSLNLHCFSPSHAVLGISVMRKQAVILEPVAGNEVSFEDVSLN